MQAQHSFDKTLQGNGYANSSEAESVALGSALFEGSAQI